MSDYVTSIIRTLVPSLWGTALAWLLTRVPALEVVREELTGLGLVFVAALIAGYYALVRALEPHLPPWLRVALIGAPKAPAAYVADPERVDAVITKSGAVLDAQTGKHVATRGDGHEPV